MWAEVADELAPVKVLGKHAFVLACDLERLMKPELLERDTLLLGPHDPYLDQRDRAVLLADKAKQRRVWTTVSNPGAVVHRGAVVGLWKARKHSGRLEMEAELWEAAPDDAALRELAKVPRPSRLNALPIRSVERLVDDAHRNGERIARANVR